MKNKAFEYRLTRRKAAKLAVERIREYFNSIYRFKMIPFWWTKYEK